VILILAFSVTYGYGQMHEGGHMMGQGTTGEIQQGQATAPGYGMMGYGGHMMGQGYGGHMMGGMMGPGGHMGCGEHMMGDMLGYGSEEEQQKFLDDTTDLRREMHNKKFDYSEALRNPDTKRTTLLKLRKEMLEIKVKMYERAIKNK
jgi:hypothetical protein